MRRPVRFCTCARMVSVETPPSSRPVMARRATKLLTTHYLLTADEVLRDALLRACLDVAEHGDTHHGEEEHLVRVRAGVGVGGRGGVGVVVRVRVRVGGQV